MSEPQGNKPPREQKPPDRLFELVERLVEDRLTPEEHAELEGLLADNPQTQRRYLAHVELHLGLQKLIPREEPEEVDPLADLARAAALAEAPGPVRDEASWPRRTAWRAAAIGSTIAAAILAAVGAWFGSGGDLGKNAGPKLAQQARARFVGDTAPDLGAPLLMGRSYALAEGQVQLEYASGVSVIIEGPSAFQIAALDRLALSVGDCSVTVPPGAEGFRVETPLAEVVDLGTRFAVQVAEDGQTDVQVVEGRAEVHAPSPPQKAGAKGPAKPMGKPAKLRSGEAVRCQEDGEVRPATFSPARFRRQLADRIVRYQATKDASGGADELISVTVQRGGKSIEYPVDRLIPVELLHFKSSGSTSNLAAPEGDRLSRTPDPQRTRRSLLESDRRLTTGAINPGGSREPLSRDPVMNDPEQKDSPNTPGLGVRFARPVRNGPGPDVVFFDLHVVIHPEQGDPFHVSPLEFQPGLKSATIRRYDIDLTSVEAQRLAKFLLYTMAAPPTSRSHLEEIRHNGGAEHTVAAKGLAVGIDLSDLGYAPGALVPGLFFQDAVDDSNYIDPVFIAGLPE